jgi:hypothetical protein
MQPAATIPPSANRKALMQSQGSTFRRLSPLMTTFVLALRRTARSLAVATACLCNCAINWARRSCAARAQSSLVEDLRCIGASLMTILSGFSSEARGALAATYIAYARQTISGCQSLRLGGAVLKNVVPSVGGEYKRGMLPLGSVHSDHSDRGGQPRSSCGQQLSPAWPAVSKFSSREVFRRNTHNENGDAASKNIEGKRI